MESYMLTTVDNPYDPFTEFDDWYMYDTEKGYNSCAYLDRIADTSPNFTEEENEQIVQDAIDYIVRNCSLGIYTKAIEGKANGLNHITKSNNLQKTND